MSLSPSSSTTSLSNYMLTNPVNIDRSSEILNSDHHFHRFQSDDLPRFSSAPIPITQSIFQGIIGRDHAKSFSYSQAYVGSPTYYSSHPQFTRRLLMPQVAAYSAALGRLDEAKRKYFQVRHDLDEGYFNFNEQECLVEYLRSKNSNDYYTFSTSSLQRCLVKVFNEALEGRIGTRFDSRIENSLKNYQKLKALGIAVVEIYNEESAPSDGYIVSSFIPKVLTDKKFSGKVLEALKDDEKFILTKIKNLFEITDRSRIFVQLEPGDIVLRESNELVLTEFSDELVKEEEFESKLILQMKKWSDHRSIQEFLMSDMSERFKACYLEASKACDLSFDLDLD